MQAFETDTAQERPSTVSYTRRWQAQKAAQVFVEGGWLVGKSTLCHRLCAALPAAVYLPEPAHCYHPEKGVVASHYLKQHQSNMNVADKLQRRGKPTIVERSWISTFAYSRAIGEPIEDIAAENMESDVAWDAPRTFVILERTHRLPAHRNLGGKGEFLDMSDLKRYYLALEGYCRRLNNSNIAWLVNCDADRCLSEALKVVENVFHQASPR